MAKKIFSKSKEILFVRSSSAPFTNKHGMEVSIGKLGSNCLKQIKNLLTNGEYFESKFFKEFYNYNSEYHNNGIYVRDDLSDTFDAEIKSSTNFELDEDDDSKFIDYELQSKGAYICSIRNETKEFFAKGKFDKSNKILLKGHVDRFVFLRKLDIYVNILTEVSFQNTTLERDSLLEEQGEIFDLYQFIFINNKVICCITNTIEADLQYPFDDLNKGVKVIRPDTKVSSKILNALNHTT